MIIQHNLAAMNANEANRKNVSGLKKKTEKLSTGYKINRAADNAAGLSISEKMRSQINGLSQASCNSNDAASLIQTAEGGLNESEDIVQRMRELAVQAANGTYTDYDRQQIQYEIDALKSEVDRIAESTEFNTMKLLDGSKAGRTFSDEYGARYGIVAGEEAGSLSGAILTSNIAGVEVVAVPDASGRGGENAFWSEDGKTLTMNLTPGEIYPQSYIDSLIKNANYSKTQPYAPPDITLSFDPAFLRYEGDIASTGAAVPGVRATGSGDLRALVNPARDPLDGQIDSADKITFTANTYGAPSDLGYAHTIEIRTDVGAGEERVEINDCKGYDGAKDLTLHLSTGVTYTEKDFENLLAKAGFDYSVDLSDQAHPDGDSDDHIRFLYSATKPLKEIVGYSWVTPKEKKPIPGTDYRVEKFNVATITAFSGNGQNYYTKNSAGKYVSVPNGTAFDPNETYYTRELAKADVDNGFEEGVNYFKLEKVTVLPQTTESGYRVTSDKTPVPGKKYYVHKYKKADDLADTGFREGLTYYNKNDDGKMVYKTGPYDPNKEYYLLEKTELADVSNGFEPNETYLEYINNKPIDDIGAIIELRGGQGVGYKQFEKNGDGLIFQIGANGVEDQKLYVTIDDMRAEALGLDDVYIDPIERALEALGIIDGALNSISTQRSKLGAVQNRLEHTVNSLNTANENMTASESQIRDTDMALEMTGFLKDNILQQASQAMLAQANQMPQSILQMLG